MREVVQYFSQDFWHFLAGITTVLILGEIAIRLLQAWRGVRYYDCNCKCGE